MAKVLTPHLKTLIFDALLASFWRRSTLQRFVRDCGVSANFAGSLAPDESKRYFLERLFAELDGHRQETTFMLKLANALAEQRAFPDLLGWEDTSQKLMAAERAVRTLRQHLEAAGVDVDTRTRLSRAAIREAELRNSQQFVRRRLTELHDRLSNLALQIGTQQAGYAFQEWFYDLMALAEVVSRPPYVSDGRQIDGTITVEGTTYIVELKFTQAQACAPDVDSLAHKVSKKADNTMGVLVSMSGYSSTAKIQASGAGTKLLLLDYTHVHLVLAGHDFAELLSRVRRHASQTGQAYLDATALG